MKWLKRREDGAGASYWDTISDVMSTLLLILMLVMALLILYVVQAPDYNTTETVPESVIVDDGEDTQYIEEEAGNTVVQYSVPYWLSGAETEEYGRGENWDDYLYETGGYDDEEFDGHAGAAVQVIVADAETRKPIQEAGVAFALYTGEGRRRLLHTYYPSLTTWSRFATTSAGSFMLPEKIPLTSYTLHELTTPVGYQAAEDVEFTVEEPYTWDYPYQIYVYLTPKQKTISVRAVDNITGDAVPGCVFNVIAAENVTTVDGSVRYTSGTVVDTLTTDEEGYAQSKALYLGNYTIKQTTAPDYYAVGKQNYAVRLADDSEAGTVEQVIGCDRTRFVLTVVDELYSNTKLSDAGFTLTAENSDIAVALVTDEDGVITLDALDKQTLYTLTQTSAPEGYQVNEEHVLFYVDINGDIDENVISRYTLTNRTLRLAVLIQDMLFKKSVADCRVSLYDSANHLVNVWNSTNLETLTEGLSEGSYRLEITGAGTLTETIQVDNVAQIQNVNCSVWTTGNKLMVGGSAACVGIVVLGTVLLLRRRKRK